MHLSPALISQLIQLAGLALGGWLLRILSTPKARDVALHLAQIASDVVNLLVAENPGHSWDDYLASAVDTIRNAAGLNVTDQAAIRRAAAQALSAKGIAPVKPQP